MKPLLPSFLLCCSLAAAASAQDPPRLRLEPGGVVTGARTAGAPCFPLAALEPLGGTLASAPAGHRLLLYGDTIELQATSPFLRAGRQLHQLAHPPALVDGALCVPEQFFIQWLPARYRERLAYRDGALRLLGAAAPGAAAGSPPPAGAARREPSPGPAAPRPAAPPPAQAKPAARVVIIDPGHGGVDPGKVGPNGLAEKQVVLQISNRVAAVLRERGFEVHLTRTRDTLVALDDRPRIANRLKGERPMALFVSIHANAAPGRVQAQGFETFFLSDARTEDERRVAEMENAAVEFEDGNESHGSDFEQLLNTLRNDFYVRASNDLAEVVQQSLATFHPGPNRGVKRAGFRVLVGAIMPAVLVEVAFISDREEARALGTAAFQQKLAHGIAEAVAAFFERNEHLWTESGGR